MINTGLSLLKVMHDDQSQGNLIAEYVKRRKKEDASSSGTGFAFLFVGAFAGAVAWALIENFLSSTSDGVPEGDENDVDEGASVNHEDLTEEDLAAFSEDAVQDLDQASSDIDAIDTNLADVDEVKAIPVPNVITQAQPKDPKTKPETEKTGFVSRMRDWLSPTKASPSDTAGLSRGGDKATSAGAAQGQGPGHPAAASSSAPAGYKSKASARPTAEVDSAIRGAANANVDYSTLYSIAGVESTFRTKVGASTSKAVGLFQFLPKTWKYLLTKNPHLNYTLDDRMDPVKAANMAAIYLTSIKKTLRAKLGREPYLVDLYMGYFLGPTGASNFLKALKEDPSQIGTDLFVKAARDNPGVFLSKDRRPISLGQIYENLGGKLGRYYADAKSSVGTSAPQIALAPKDVEAKVSPPAVSEVTISAPSPTQAPTQTQSSVQAKPSGAQSAGPSPSARPQIASTSSIQTTISSSGNKDPAVVPVSPVEADSKRGPGQGRVPESESESESESERSNKIQKRDAVAQAKAVPQPMATGGADEVIRTNNVKIQSRLQPLAEAETSKTEQDQKSVGAGGGSSSQPSSLMLVKRNGVIYALPQG